VSVVQTTQEAEAGGLLEPRCSGPPEQYSKILAQTKPQTKLNKKYLVICKIHISLMSNIKNLECGAFSPPEMGIGMLPNLFSNS
jgi:hypothetical protein